jgi:ABC-type transport system involved in cytochrome bd biosynthesis fused ATPase/permease subunit
VKEQPQGLNTIIYPEGKQIPYTISKKILLARSFITRPKLLILKDPLDQFAKEEEHRIMKFLTDPTQPWGLIVISHNPGWSSECSQLLSLEKGRIIN